MTNEKYKAIMDCMKGRLHRIHLDECDIAAEYALRLHRNSGNEGESLRAFQELRREKDTVLQMIEHLGAAGPAASCWGEENV